MDTYLTSEHEFVVAAVNPKSYLYASGLRCFDRIIRFDSTSARLIKNSNYLRNKAVGDTIVIYAVRGKDTLSFSAIKK
jgi:hypothetical protein